MSKSTKDELWKSIIEDLFEDFMHYFFPNHVHLIDFEKGYTFLDKELHTILPDSENKNRRADKLVKVWLKNGEEKWILIHIEVVWYEIRKNRLSDENLLETAKKIVWKLAREGYERRTIQKVLQFIKYYTPFEKKKFFHKFEEEISIV